MEAMSQFESTTAAEIEIRGNPAEGRLDRTAPVRVICYASASNRPFDVPLQDQTTALAAFSATQKGWALIGVYLETQNGKRLRDRPQFQRVEHAMRAGQADVVLVTQMDRLSQNHSELAWFVGLADHCRVQLWTTTGELPPMTGPALALVAGLGLGDKRDQTARRLQVMNRQGRHVGRRPFGYKLVRKDGQGGHLIVDAEEAAVVKQIYDRYLNGASLPAIGGMLNDMGVSSPQGKKWKLRNLSQNGVLGVLHDVLYVGFVVSGIYATVEDVVTGRRLRVLQPQEKWNIAKGLHEPIVSDEVFAAAQKRYRDERKPV
jgi:site-specific DNA recombinase